MERKIIFASGKGGVGKSTIVANVAVAFARLGSDVGMIDTDVSMSDLALSLGLETESATIHEVLAGEAEVKDAIYLGPEDVKVLPGGVSLDGIRKANLKKLEGVVDRFSKEVELVLIDSPSSLGSEALACLKSGEELVLVTAPVITSVSSALRTKEVAEKFGLDVIGVVISRASNSDLEIPKDEIESMLDLPILSVIPEDSEVQRSTSVGSPVMIRAPESPSGRGFLELAAKIIAGEKKTDYMNLLDNPIEIVKERVEDLDVNYRVLLELERAGEEREELLDWLEDKIQDLERE